MTQKDKTKEDLIEEIKLLEKRIVELETVKQQQQQDLLYNLQSERDRLDAVINSISDEIWFADVSKKFILANFSARQQFNLDAANLIDVESLAKSLEVCRPDMSIRPVEEAPPLRALRGEEVRNQEEIVRIPVSGELRYRQVNASPIRDAAGSIIRAVSVVRDITERKKAEEKLSHFRKAVDSATDAIGMSTPEGRHYYQNEAFTKLFGLSVKETDGASGPSASIYSDEKVGRKVFDTIMRGDSFTGEVKMLAKDKSEKDILLRAYSIKDGEGKVIGLVGIHTDITERKKIEEETQKRLQELEVFYKASVGREERILELKKQVAELEEKLKGA